MSIAKDGNFRADLARGIRAAETQARERIEYIAKLESVGTPNADLVTLRNDWAAMEQRVQSLKADLSMYDSERELAGRVHDDWSDLGGIASRASRAELETIIHGLFPDKSIRLLPYGAQERPHFHILADMRVHSRAAREAIRTSIRAALQEAFSSYDGRVVEFVYW